MVLPRIGYYTDSNMRFLKIMFVIFYSFMVPVLGDKFALPFIFTFLLALQEFPYVIIGILGLSSLFILLISAMLRYYTVFQYKLTMVCTIVLMVCTIYSIYTMFINGGIVLLPFIFLANLLAWFVIKGSIIGIQYIKNETA